MNHVDKQSLSHSQDAPNTDEQEPLEDEAGIKRPLQAVPSDFGFLQPPSIPGTLGSLAHYSIVKVLGQGGFGIVFEAMDTRLQRSVAIKVLSPSLATTSPARKRFLREARAAAAVRHVNIVQIYGVQEEPIPYIVMELIRGQSLQQRCHELGPLPLKDVLSIGSQVASGLSAAHKKDLCHRDIKPDNILIESLNDCCVKITDFGLARTAEDANLTRTGAIVGTPMYMAPEQALEKTVDHRSDLFSLGSVLYLLITGRPPYRASTAIAVLRRVVEDEPRGILEIIPETPAWMCAIISKLHAKSPADRFQSAEEVAVLLATCLEQLERLEPVTAANDLLTKRSYAVRPDQPRGTSKYQRYRAAGLIALISLAIVVVGSFVFFRDHVTDSNSDVGSSSSFKDSPNASSLPEPVSKTVPAERAVAPFDRKQAQAYQVAWSQQLREKTEFKNRIGMRLRLIPPGEFFMGSVEDEIMIARAEATKDEWIKAAESESPQHKVILSQPFYLGVCEVTQKQYGDVMNTKSSSVADEENVGAAQAKLSGAHPVDTVSWLDAIEFCNKLSQMESRSLYYQRQADGTWRRHGSGYRLPTEAEWEFACRAGTTTKYWIGEEDYSVDKAGWTSRKASGSHHPTGKLEANPFGIFDTIGNVWEWVDDAWQEDYYQQFANTDATDPRNDDASEERAIRGGCFNTSPTKARSAARRQKALTSKNDHIGFRVALGIEVGHQP